MQTASIPTFKTKSMVNAQKEVDNFFLHINAQLSITIIMKEETRTVRIIIVFNVPFEQYE